jgi:hypothetical protein
MLQCLLHPAQILTKQARQKDLTPLVLALSVSQTGDGRPKDSGGGEPLLQNVQGNHEQRNQQANLPLFNIE